MLARNRPAPFNSHGGQGCTRSRGNQPVPLWVRGASRSARVKRGAGTASWTRPNARKRRGTHGRRGAARSLPRRAHGRKGAGSVRRRGTGGGGSAAGPLVTAQVRSPRCRASRGGHWRSRPSARRKVPLAAAPHEQHDDHDEHDDPPAMRPSTSGVAQVTVPLSAGSPDLRRATWS